MLVLLIIMMLIAPLLQQGVDVTLPEAGNTADKPDTQDQTVVAIDSAEPVLGQRRSRSSKDELRRRGSRPRSRTRPRRSSSSRATRTRSTAPIMEAMDELRAGRDRGHRPDHRTEEGARTRRREASSMAHAHKHFGAEKVVTGETPHASADMNVTPLIDVLLVLLIIFMADPAADAERRRHQPAARDQERRRSRRTTRQIVLEYTADRQISINKQPVTMQRARDAAPRHLRDPQGQDDVHRRRRRRCATATSSPSSTPPRAPVSRRSASSPKSMRRAAALEDGGN